MQRLEEQGHPDLTNIEISATYSLALKNMNRHLVAVPEINELIPLKTRTKNRKNCLEAVPLRGGRDGVIPTGPGIFQEAGVVRLEQN